MLLESGVVVARVLLSVAAAAAAALLLLLLLLLLSVRVRVLVTAWPQDMRTRCMHHVHTHPTR